MENIEVALRIRPINQQELESKDIEIWTTQASDVVGISAEKYSDLIRMRKIAPGQKTQYIYNRCFDQNAQNNSIYDRIVKRIALSSLKGINGTVFMYGQTGSGKTFTMLGQNKQDSIHNLNGNNSKENASLYNQMQNRQNSVKLIGDPLSPKNLVTKESSSRLSSKQQSSQKNLISQNKQNGSQKQQQYNSRSPPKQRDSSNQNSLRDNQENQGNLNQFGGLNSLKINNQTDKSNILTQNSGMGAFKNSGFSPINTRDNFFKKKNTTQQSSIQNNNRSQSVTPDKYLSTNSQKSQTVNGLNEVQTFTSISGRDGLNISDNSNQYGVLMLSLIDIFKEIQNSPNSQFLLRCSYVEIYTDFVYDLLKPQDKLTETLQIGEDYNKEFFIKGAVEEIVSSIEEIIQLLRYGEHNRHYASTAMNHISSRSHTIFRLYVRSMPRDLTNGNDGITESILNFVDLAGSEKINIHQANKGSLNNLFAGNNTNNGGLRDRQIESKTINKIISLKSQGKQELHIPYRNSPLTKILRSSLGGNSRTAIILCINPCLSQLEQTISTLRFGQNARKVENQVKQNVIQVQNVDILQNMIKEYETRIVELESEQNVHKVNSDNLVKMISTLIEQKSNLEQRIKAKELFDSQQSGQRQIQFRAKKKKNVHQDFIHIDNIGLIKVYDDIWDQVSDKPNSSRDITKEIQGNKCAFRKIKNVNEQKKILEEQVQFLRCQLQQKEQDQNKILQRQDKKLAGKKRKLQTMKANKITLGIENSRLKQELALYRNQNIDGLKKLSLCKLEKLEQNAELLLKNIRNQMSILQLKREFDGDTTILDRINKTLNLREQMDCELVELANDFFEPNLQLNTTLYDEDDSMMYEDTNDGMQYQYHNIHNGIRSSDLEQLQKMPQNHDFKNKFIYESPLVFGVSPRDTISCLSYKIDEEQNQLSHHVQNQQNTLNQHSSLTNLNPTTSISKSITNKSSLNNLVFGSLLNYQQGNNGIQTFGTFQNYFNQVNQKQNKQVISSQFNENINTDQEITNKILLQNNNLNNNIAIQESQRSSTLTEYPNLLFIESQNHNNIQNKSNNVHTYEDPLKEKDLEIQFKKENLPIKTIVSTSQSNLITSGQDQTLQRQTNLISNGLVMSNNDYSVQQNLQQSQQSGLEINSNNLNAILQQLNYQSQNTQSKQPSSLFSSCQSQNLRSQSKPELNSQNALNTDILKPISSDKADNISSPINNYLIKGDQFQFLQQSSQPHLRSCSMGQNFRSHQHLTNDINTEALTLTQDFQEPLFIDKELKQLYQNNQTHKNRWDGVKTSNSRQASKDQFESVESKYVSNVQSNQSNHKNNITPINSNSELCEKKLVDKLFGKENKHSQENSVQNQPKLNSREGPLQQSKGYHNHHNSSSQQKYSQSLKKTLSQKDILGSKLQIIMNQNNPSNISNTTFAHLALQHQQNRHIVQQLINQPTNSMSTRSQQNTLITQNNCNSHSASPDNSHQSLKLNNSQIQQSIYQDNGQKIDSNQNRLSVQNQQTK